MGVSGVLLHVVGVAAVAQLIWTHKYQQTYPDLYSNATTVLHQTWDKLASSVSVLLPKGAAFGSGVSLLQPVLYLAVAVYALYLIRKLKSVLFGQFEFYQPEENTGFEYPQREVAKGLISKRDVINEVRRRRKYGELPPVYPNGWFGLLRSEHLPVGGSTSVNALGQNFAVFRDEEGVVHILDAYCAHLGANLAVGGKVTGKCIECPFHGWQYDGETGHCVKIPYSKGKVPSQAKVKVWPSLDSNGIVKVWYDAEGRDPQWFPEEFEKVKNGRWSYRGCSTHLINAHIEDIPENGADMSHLNYLHKAGIASGSHVNYKELLSGKIHTHDWTGNWESLPAPNTHVGRMTVGVVNRIFGIKISTFGLNVTADQIGPGVVHLTFKSILGSGLLLQVLTPQEPLLQKYSLLAYADWWIPTFVIKSMVRGYDVQLERDMIAWNNKSYKLKPLLVREDELILKHRRWYSQFYSENSPRLTFKKEDDLSF